MMRTFLTLSIAALMSAASIAQSTPFELPQATVKVISWARMSAPAYGCFLEKKMGHRDDHFNCALKNYHNSGDVCKSAGKYYEGPEFPKTAAEKINPMATDIELSWEHGELQQIIILLKGNYPESAVRRAFQLPASTDLPKNVASLSIETVTPEMMSISIVGFDHTGAGDVDCPHK